jgi:phosphoglycolate phosphatase-like HAD superfamily hydrolase
MSSPRKGRAPRLRAVAFDLDGTLADDVPLTFDAFRYACRPYLGRELTNGEIAAQFGPTQEGIAAALAPGHGGECVARFLDFFETRFDQYVQPLDGIGVLLADIRRRGLHSAIVTGAGESSVQITVAKLRLQTSVERVLTGRPQGSRKHEQLLELATTWRCRAGQIAYVGDAASDMIVARDVGALPLGAAWNASSDGEALRRAGAREVFATPDALGAWLFETPGDAEVHA